MNRTKTLTVLVLDNIKVSFLSRKINRAGLNVILAFDDENMYPYFENMDSDSVINNDYNPGLAAENALRLIDDLNPDLILLGNCRGAGLDKSFLFPKNKKLVTIVLSNNTLEGEEFKAYDKRDFKRFCVRSELLKCFSNFLLEVQKSKDPKDEAKPHVLVSSVMGE